LVEGLTTSLLKDGSSCVQSCGGKPPFFDGTCSDYWKRKMKMYLGSINDQVWDVTKRDYVIIDPTNLTNQDKANRQCYNAIDSKVFEQIKDCERANEV
jgi:hypothetical protein